jgi:hypothetical protein
MSAAQITRIIIGRSGHFLDDEGRNVSLPAVSRPRWSKLTASSRPAATSRSYRRICARF